MRILAALGALVGSAYAIGFGLNTAADDYYGGDYGEPLDYEEAPPTTINPLQMVPYGQPGSCDCKCKCEFLPANPCNLDFIILLDAASCVRNVWNEMKLRIVSVANQIDHYYPMGEQTRFAVISYANEAELNIGLDENMGYGEFASKMETLETINEGSFLNVGLQKLYQYSEASMVAGRQQIVIVVTNGKSHPDANVDRDQLKEFAQDLNAQLPGDMEGFYINTIVPIETDKYAEENELGQFLDSAGNIFEAIDSDNKDKYECPGCGWNEALFLDIRGVGRVGRDGPLGLDNIISKVNLLQRMAELVDNVCPVAASRELCTDCECNCFTMVGVAGEVGPPGAAGLKGPDGECGADGQDGVDGEVGVSVKGGAKGCDAPAGNPGAHGAPGQEGECGVVGKSGIQGVRGRPGPDGTGQGSPGPDGWRGDAGEAGAQGSAGGPGSHGPRGDVGAQGPDGKAGMPGEPGLPGYCGKQGSNGRPGQPGSPGAPGNEGIRGEAGMDGGSGDAGDKGEDGVAGEQGPCGMDGAVGGRGPQGAKGMPGNTGPRGGVESTITMDVNAYIRSQVDAILGKYLVYTSAGRGRVNEKFCECKRWEVYRSVFKMN